jgi:thiamine-phosphate pyrophosphorylase
MLQIRAKRLASGPLLVLCEVIVKMAASYQALVIVNDRVDVARMAGAAGVHVGQDDLAPTDARRLLGPDAVVGFSTHTVSQIEAALPEPISYVAVGPVFGTGTKETGYDAVGLDLVSKASQLAGRTPVVAIGGITLRSAASVVQAGASSVAVISDLLVTGNPRARVEAYLRTLGHRV